MEPVIIQPAQQPPQDKPPKWRAVTPALLLRLGAAIILSALVAILFFSRSKPEPRTDPVVLSEEELSNLRNNTQSPDRTLTVAGHGTFKGSLTVEKDLNVAGKLNLSGDTSIAQLEVTGPAKFNSTLTVDGSASIQGPVSIGGAITVAGNGSFGGTLAAAGINAGTMNVSALNLGGHLRSGGLVPTASAGAAAGGGGASVQGNDTAGTVTINTGNGSLTGILATIRFRTKYGAAPRIVLTPVGSNTAGLRYYADRNADFFSIGTSSATNANQSYSFDYYVIE
jgi:cytoskeletal protein CcmA (bactofilin family)